MKLSSLEVVEKLVRVWLTGVTASLITYRQITAYYTHHKHPHNFIPSLLRTVLRVLVYSPNILQVSTDVGGCLQCGREAMGATNNKNIPNIYWYTWWSENFPRYTGGAARNNIFWDTLSGPWSYLAVPYWYLSPSLLGTKCAKLQEHWTSKPTEGTTKLAASLQN